MKTKIVALLLLAGCGSTLASGPVVTRGLGGGIHIPVSVTQSFGQRGPVHIPTPTVTQTIGLRGAVHAPTPTVTQNLGGGVHVPIADSVAVPMGLPHDAEGFTTSEVEVHISE